MFLWIFKIVFVFIIGQCFLDIAYRYPTMIFDMGVVCIGFLLYYLFILTRRLQPRLFITLLIAGLLLAVFNLIPFERFEPEANVKLVHTSISVMVTSFYKNQLPIPVIKNLSEMGMLAKQYYILFLLKQFFMVFFASLLISELTHLRLKWKATVSEEAICSE